MLHQTLDKINATFPLRGRYENFISGKWMAPVRGQYFDNPTPVTGAEAVRGRPLDRRGHRAGAGCRPCGEGQVGPHIAGAARPDPEPDRRPDGGAAGVAGAGRDARQRQANPRDTAADMPLAIDHFRYFAGCIRAQEGSLSARLDHDTVAYHFHEPLGVVGQIIPWNFPILMAAWKLAPALAAGNCVVLKPAEQTPA